MPPSGPSGFEGLVARLLTAFTGRTFRLAASGTQEGEDLSARSRDDLVIATECKRYREKTDFDREALDGKMVAAFKHDRDLDLWLLVATRPVPSQLRDALVLSAELLGISVDFLDHDPAGLGPLPVLCARYPEITLAALPPHEPPLAHHLDQIRQAPRFAAVLDELHRKLSRADLGYASARAALNGRFSEALADSRVSLDLFEQRLLPREEDSLDLPRAAVDAALDAWWQSWPNQRMAVLHGQEGTGKTWNLASWLARQVLPGETAPLVLWSGSRGFDFDFESSPLLDLGGRILARHLLSPPRAVHERRLRNWTAGTKVIRPCPRVVFVVDGLNERPRADDWGRWLLAADRELSDGLGQAALVLTCRSSFWDELRPLFHAEPGLPRQGIERAPVPRPAPREIQVSDFTDGELDNLLASCGWAPPVEPALRRLLRRPRHFKHAARHWARYAASGDFTVERLFFEDWRSRQERAHQPISDAGFQRLLGDLARRYRDGAFGRLDLARLLADNPDIARALEELTTGGILEPVPGAPDRYRLERHRLHLGLGLLLMQQVSEAASTSLDQALESAAAAIETGADAEDSSFIISNAVCIALNTSGPHTPPPDAVLALLLALARQRNAADAWEKARPWSYYPQAPEIFQRLAETEWSKQHADYRAQERIAFVFAKIAEKWPADPALAAMCHRWLSFVHPAPLRPRHHPGADEELQKRRHELESRLAGIRAFTDPQGITPVPVASRSLLSISHLALLTMSQIVVERGPLPSYGAALTAWALGSTSMGGARTAAQAEWLVRFAGAGLWAELRDFAERLAVPDHPLLRGAAARLLKLEASPVSWERAIQLEPMSPPALLAGPADLEEARNELDRMKPAAAARWLSHRALDPKVDLEGIPWGYRRLLRSVPVSDVCTGRQKTGMLLELEEADTALSRTAPAAYAAYARRVASFLLRRLPAGAGLHTQILAEHFLLLSRRQLSKARAILPGIEQDGSVQPYPRAEETADLAAVVLAGLATAAAQKSFLLQRVDTFDDEDWSELLAPLPPAGVRTMIRALPRSDGIARRRLLWFPWREPLTLSIRQREILRRVPQDREVATLAGLVPQRARDPGLLLAAIHDRVLTDEWLSRIMASQPWAHAAVTDAPEELRRDLGPESRSWVLAEAGLDPSAVRQWALELDGILRQLSPGSALGASGQFATSTVKAALRTAPDVTGAWIDALADHTHLSMRLTNIHFSLTSALLVALLDDDNERAIPCLVRILRPGTITIRRIDQASGVPSLWFLPFRAADTTASRQATRLLFDQAFTDNDLQCLGYAASLYRRFGSLIEQLTPAARPDRTLNAARHLALLALGVQSERTERLIATSAARATGWENLAFEWALRRQRQDAAARHWFRRFLECPSRDESWAAFRLFLHCVDRRWLLWHLDEIHRAEQAADFEPRRRNLELNRHEIERRIKARSEDDAKHLCGQPLPSSDLLPWKRTWRL
jgi:hypothetical protein